MSFSRYGSCNSILEPMSLKFIFTFLLCFVSPQISLQLRCFLCDIHHSSSWRTKHMADFLYLGSCSHTLFQGAPLKVLNFFWHQLEHLGTVTLIYQSSEDAYKQIKDCMAKNFYYYSNFCWCLESENEKYFTLWLCTKFIII